MNVNTHRLTHHNNSINSSNLPENRQNQDMTYPTALPKCAGRSWIVTSAHAPVQLEACADVFPSCLQRLPFNSMASWPELKLRNGWISL